MTKLLSLIKFLSTGLASFLERVRKHPPSKVTQDDLWIEMEYSFRVDWFIAEEDYLQVLDNHLREPNSSLVSGNGNPAIGTIRLKRRPHSEDGGSFLPRNWDKDPS